MLARVANADLFKLRGKDSLEPWEKQIALAHLEEIVTEEFAPRQEDTPTDAD